MEKQYLSDGTELNSGSAIENEDIKINILKMLNGLTQASASNLLRSVMADIKYYSVLSTDKLDTK